MTLKVASLTTGHDRGGWSLVSACADTPTDPREDLRSLPPAAVIVLPEKSMPIADADLLRHSHRRRGFSPVVYGNQGATVRLLPRRLSSPSRRPRRAARAQVGIRNLLEHVVRRRAAGAAPPDTIGFFVFFVSGPVAPPPAPATPAR